MDFATKDHLRQYRLWKGLLHPDRLGYSIHTAISHFLALPATDIHSAYLALLNRVHFFSTDSFEEYLYVAQQAGRLRGMRKQLFIIPRENHELIYSGTYQQREYLIKKNLKNLSVTEEAISSISAIVLHKIGMQEKTRAQLKKIFSKQELKSITLDKPRSRLTTSIFDQALGVLLDRWQITPGHETWNSQGNYFRLCTSRPEVKDDPSFFDVAERNLVEQYIRCYGPVLESDIAWWCGLTFGRVRKILAEPVKSIKRISLLEKEYWIWEEESKSLFDEIPTNTGCYLLGFSDPLLNGYESHTEFIDESFSKQICSPAGIVKPTVLVDGEMVGLWTSHETKESLNLKIELFKNINRKQEDKLCIVIAKTGDFLAGDSKISNVELSYL